MAGKMGEKKRNRYMPWPWGQVCFASEHAYSREIKKKGQIWAVLFIQNLSNQISDLYIIPGVKRSVGPFFPVLSREGIISMDDYLSFMSKRRGSFLPLRHKFVENITWLRI